jgi:hypothetical protein
MGFMDLINEQIYILFSMYYYEVFLYQQNILVGRLIQLVSYNPTYIVDFKRKLAWIIIKDRAFIKGHKIILHYDVDYALPLSEVKSEQIEEVNKNLLRIRQIVKLSGEYTKEEIDKSKNKLITLANYPPHMIFEMQNATFVTKIMSSQKVTDWATITIVIMVVILIIAFMAIMVFGVLK